MNGLLATVDAVSKFKRAVSPEGNKNRRRQPTVDAETTWLWRILQEDPINVDEVVELIEAKEAEVNMKDKTFGWTPIHFAANTGQAGLLKILLEAKAYSDVVCHEGNSALILAARRGHCEAVEYLMSKKVNLNVRNNNGWSALTWAAINGHDDIATTLIAASADYNITDNNGRTACMWAARHGYLDIVEALLLCGINLGARDDAGLTAMDHATEHMELRSAMAAAEEVNRGLLDAAKRGDADGVQEAIGKGANLEMRNEDGWTPLMWSALHGKLDLVEVLVRHGAKPSLLDDKGESIEKLGEHYQAVGEALDGILGANGRMVKAAKEDRWAAVEEELAIGAWVNVRDDDKRTVLMWACRHGQLDPLISLRNKGADLDLRDDFGWTSLLFAVWAKSYETVSALFYFGAGFQIRSYDGDSAMHVAVRAEDGVMIQLLFAANTDIEEPNVEGYTPLQVAALTGLPQAMRTLLACGASAGVKDRHSRSPFLMAVVAGHCSVAQCMLEPLPNPPKMPMQNLSGAGGIQMPNLTRNTSQPKDGRAAPRESSVDRGKKKTATLIEAPPAQPKAASRKTLKIDTGKAMPKSKGLSQEKKSKLGNQKELITKAENIHSLFHAADEKRKDLCKKLPILGRKILTEQDDEGRSALALAVVYNNQDMVPLLIKEKADVNASNAEGFTVLMEAVTICRRPRIVEALLEAGARIDARNKEGKRAADLADDKAIRDLLDKYEISKTLPVGAPPDPSAEKEAAPRRGSKLRPVFRIRIEHLPLELTADILEEHIRSLMRRIGATNPLKVEVAIDPISSRPRGYAYVNFADAAAADLMLRGNGEIVGGNALRIYRDAANKK